MKKSALLLAAAALLSTSLPVSTQPGSATAPTSAEDRAKALHAIFHDYWEQTLKRNPEFASTLGDKRYNDQLSDYSVKAINDWLAVEQEMLLKLAAIDPAGLPDQDQVSRDLLIHDLTEEQEGAEFKAWEMPVNQMGGIYAEYPQLVAQLSFTTAKDYDDWIARLRALPHAFDQVTANMSLGIDDKRVPPKFLLEKTLDQVKQLANQNAEDSPLALPLKKFPDSISAAEQTRIKTEMLAAISKQVLPAYQRFARFLEVSYIPAGRAEPGISSLPDGAAYYKFRIKESTTTNLTADQIHQIGLDEVKRDEAEMLAIAQKLGFQDLKSFRASLKTNPKLKATSRDQLLETYRGYLGPMQAKLPELFGHLPKSPFEVVPVPDYLEKTSAPAYYQAGTPDGSRPGRLFIDTYNPTDRDLYQVEAIAYHEGLPGHHLQISISRELQGVPDFRKFGGYSAFAEGWGLYSERLGKDIGLYKDPYSDYGRLQADIWRAIRLVVDTGVHSQHWTRQQMVDFFHNHSTIDETSMQAEVDRYIAWPGQALAYKIGQLEILKLRDQAKKELGAKFDIRAFHDQVIDSGALPLDVLDERVTHWIAAQKSTSK
ncbi:DUF885 domain-containing protein [Occallatibacter savannae]|uniref:DUF885 domain-containing protein n=1 Tax=Occallatibacter savannae TaxID=1002691 RepID=UPI001EF561FC|nr:DUF885 domain-containing protein [Occallatibacter savannae]